MACETKRNSAFAVELTVDGNKIELNDFVTDFISETVAGMLKSLRDVGDIETVDLKISRKPKDSQVQ